ncbi:MAG: glycosyltransferase family 2 protein [Bacteroidia bacterium]|nr:glycosyltransferase family 2 protein [Bacteroidia bacterium]
MGYKKLDSRSVHKYFERFHSDVADVDAPFNKKHFDLIIVIPAKNERDLKDTIISLSNCKTTANFGVIVILNASKNDPTEVKKCNMRNFTMVEELKKDLEFPLFAKVLNNIDPKYAGVGNARKIGMDLALKQFSVIDNNGVIVNLDADCLVSENYIQEIHRTFSRSEADLLATLHFEHQDGVTPIQSRKIELYELHLRYYVNGLRSANYPFHMHTVGSCIAVSASAYCKFGGMNRRKAGEDFYFIHKLATQIRHLQISEATVFPSARNSDRVPFGTGASMIRMESETPCFFTYDPVVFSYLSKLMADFHKDSFYENPKITQDISNEFLDRVDFNKHFERLRENTAGRETFDKKLFQWFDGFKVMKYVHYVTETLHPKIDVEDACRSLLVILGKEPEKNLLNQYRSLDRSTNW